MKAYHVALFVICICLAFPLLEPTGVFNGIGPAGSTAEELKTLPNYSSAFLVASVVTALGLGGMVIAGWSFKTSSVLGAFCIVYIFASSFMETFLWTLMNSSGLTHSENLLIIGVLTTLFGFIGVWGAIQLAGTPTGIMD